MPVTFIHFAQYNYVNVCKKIVFCFLYYLFTSLSVTSRTHGCWFSLIIILNRLKINVWFHDTRKRVLCVRLSSTWLQHLCGCWFELKHHLWEMLWVYDVKNNWWLYTYKVSWIFVEVVFTTKTVVVMLTKLYKA